MSLVGEGRNDGYDQNDRNEARIIRLESAFERQERVLERVERFMEEQSREKPKPWGPIFSGVSVVITIFIAVLVGVVKPIDSNQGRMDRDITMLQSEIKVSRQELTFDRWTGSDQKAYDKDMTEWQRRQDDQILELWQQIYKIAPEQVETREWK